jgi:hypothetical protein
VVQTAGANPEKAGAVVLGTSAKRNE